MIWALGALALLAVGTVLRRVLRLNSYSTRTLLAPLDGDREAIYQSFVLEVETQAAILGISLNDAFEERDSGRDEIAWRLVQLSLGEWDRLMDVISAALNVVSHRLPLAQTSVPIRGITAKQFRTRAMKNTVRLHELLDRLMAGSGLRAQVHLRFLRRAAKTLTEQFHRAYRSGDRTWDRSDELWRMLDLYFHDFDVIAKETLLAFRGLLVAAPVSALAVITEDVKGVVERGVRSTPSPVNQGEKAR